MQKEFTLDIKDIMTIVKMDADKTFKFVCEKRRFDGFFVILSGNALYTNEQGKKFFLAAGDAVITNKDCSYTLSFENDGSYITSGLILSTDKTMLPTIYKSTKKQREKLQHICELWQSRTWDSFTRCRIELMAFYLELLKPPLSTTQNDNSIAMAVEFIHQNFRTNCSGEDVARYCSLSVSHLRSKFLKVTGLTIIGYRDKLRIDAAKELLQCGYFDIGEISTELGYCDVYHFSKAFKKYVGLSPTKWLKKQ